MDRITFLQNFRDAIENMYTTVDKKNQDYSGNAKEAFKNFLMCERLGICSTEAGILVRMSDKLSRAGTLIHQTNAVQDEKLQDTLLDLAAYAIILYIFVSDGKPTQEDKASCGPEVEG
jgi:hypothetical protein